MTNSVFSVDACLSAQVGSRVSTTGCFARGLLLALMASASPCLAQTQSGATASSSNSVPTEISADGHSKTESGTEIVVTGGSRIRRSGYDAPTPTTVIGGTDVIDRGATNVAAVLNELPSFRPTQTASTTGNSLGATVTPGANLLDLRGLGQQRTLVLVNGRRFIQTNQGAVDINLIPQALIQRVDVVTGGASAAFGSDAVSGVVNFITNDKFTGVLASSQIGISELGDNEEVHESLALGTYFAGGRGHIAVAGEYFNGQGVNPQTSRSFGAEQRQLIVNAAYAAGNGQPQYLLASNVHQTTRTEGGLINSGRFKGLQFLPDGTTTPFVYNSTNNGSYQIGGSGLNQADTQSLVVPVRRKTVATYGSYDFGNDITFQFEGSYGGSSSYNPVTSAFTSSTIQRDNAYLPAALSSQMAVGETFTLGRLDTDLPKQTLDLHQTTFRGEAGLSGPLAGDVKWSAYYQYGHSHINTLNDTSLIPANFAKAVDAVNYNGQIVCRVNASATPGDPNCVPINIFGSHSHSVAQINYLTSTEVLDRVFAENVAAGELQGDLLSIWAGKVSFAAGVEYRTESTSASVDPISQAGGYLIGNSKALAGSFNVKEAFGEVVVPLIKSLGPLHSVDFNGAVRESDYSTSGSVTTWKAGVTADVSSFARLRFTRSRDIRAPNLDELYLPVASSFQSVADPFSSTSKFAYAVQYRKGNTSLLPEKSDTTTAGIVLTPAFVPGFRASVDYFNVSIAGAIRTLAIQDIINRCAAGATNLCALIAFNSPGVPTSGIATVTVTNLNVASLKTNGLDIESSYVTRFGSTQAGIRVLATYVAKLATDAGAGSIDRAGEVGSNTNGGVPHWRVTTDLNISQGPAALTLVGRFIGAGNYDNTYVTGVTINNNHVPAFFYLDGTARVKIAQRRLKDAEFLFTVNNIRNTKPPFTPNFSMVPVPTNTAFYDVIGRSFTAGIRLQF